jgi:hypothetical protein
MRGGGRESLFAPLDLIQCTLKCTLHSVISSYVLVFSNLNVEKFNCHVLKSIARREISFKQALSSRLDFKI